MMNKAKITLDLLMDDAAAYFINLKNMGNWKMEISRNTQIIALTTQISELETKVSQLSCFKAPIGPSTMTPKGGAGTGNYSFELWRLKKVASKAEHSMIEWDGRLSIGAIITYTITKVLSLRACTSFTSPVGSMMHDTQRKIASKRVGPRSIW